MGFGPSRPLPATIFHIPGLRPAPAQAGWAPSPTPPPRGVGLWPNFPQNPAALAVAPPGGRVGPALSTSLIFTLEEHPDNQLKQSLKTLVSLPWTVWVPLPWGGGGLLAFPKKKWLPRHLKQGVTTSFKKKSVPL